jgi:gliding motility-associated-like protein
MMKKILLYALFFASAGLAFLQPVNASHLMGYDLTYECIPDSSANICNPLTLNSCEYRIFLNRYYDCSGATQDPALGNGHPLTGGLGGRANIIPIGSNCADPVAITPWTNTTYVEVTPVCATAITSCRTNPFGQNAAINGVLESRAFSEFDFCNVNCSEYELQWSANARNSVITSGASGSMFAGGTIIDLGTTPCNSSPQFSTVPVPYICAGRDFTFSQGAFDPDGDSLVFSLSPCFNASGVQVNYNGGFSPTSPLGPTWNVNIDRSSGTINLVAIPGNAEVGVLCVTVEEYRDQVKIGQVSRDIQVTIFPNCTPNNYPEFTAISNPTNARITGPFQLQACAGQETCFDIEVQDLDAADILSVRSINVDVLDPATGRIEQNGATVQVATGTGANPPIARVCFAPRFPGNYFIIMEVADDNCDLLGTSQLSVEVNVDFCGLIPITSAARTTQSTSGGAPVDCYTVEFLIEPNSCDIQYYYDIDPGDNSPIYNDTTTGTTQIFHTYPQTTGIATYTYTISVVDSLGFRFDTTATVTIVNNAVADAGPDATFCPNVPGNIGGTARLGYRYRWDACGVPGNPGLPPSPANEQAAVTIQLDNQRNTPLDITYCLTAIDSFGCPAVDDVTVTFAPKPRPDFVINGNLPEACVDEQASFQYVGLRPPTIEYLWDFSSTTSGPNNPIGPGPHFASWPNVGLPSVSLRTVVEGCTSDVVTRPIEIKPIPEASFTVTPQVCLGEDAIIAFNGRSSPQGIAFWTLDGGTVVTGDTTTLGPLAVRWSTTGPKIITLIVEDRDCISQLYRDTLIVNEIPTSTFNVLSPVCENDSMRITYTGTATPAGSYIWQFDGASTSPAVNGFQGPYTAAWDRNGPKTVCLQVQELGCVSPRTCQPVTVLPAPEAVIDPIPDICYNGGQNAAVFTYSGTQNADTYEWFFGATASQPFSNQANPAPITYSTPGRKTARLVISKNGCVSDTAYLEFEVLVDPEANFIIQTSGNVCAGDTVRFLRTGQRVSANETYNWNFGQDAVPTSSNLLDPGPVVYSSGGSKVITLVVSHGPGCEDRFASQFRVEDAPDFNAGGDLRYCEGTGGIQINANTSGGVPGYTWSWSCDRGANCGFSSSSVEDPMVNPTASGPDTVVFSGFAVDTRGCRSNIDDVNVIIDPKPKVDAGPDIFLCDGGPGTNLEGGLANNNLALGPFDWEWRDSAGNIPPAGMTNYQDPVVYTRPNQTTIYTLVAVDRSTGCTSEATTVDPNSTARVTILPRPIAEAGPDTVVCFGDQVELRGAAIGGPGNYSYQWSPNNPLVGTMSNPNAPNPVVGPLQTTTYTLVVSAFGCASVADEVTVTVHTVPTVDAGDNKVVCFSDSVQLSGRASGAPQSGLVGYSYSWTPQIGLDDPASPEPMASPGATQVFQLEVSSDFGCGSATDDVTVTVNAKPFTTVLNRDTVLCEGDQLLLTGSHTLGGTPPPNPNIIYDWQPGDQIRGDNTAPFVVARPDQTTNYVLTVTLGACSTSDEVLVSVAPAIEAGIVISDTVICSGDIINLEALGGFGSSGYTWSPAANIVNPNAAVTTTSPTQDVTYRLTLEEGACTDIAEVDVKVNKTPVVDYLSSDTEGCQGLEVSFLEQSVDGIAYRWDFGDGTVINNEQNPTHTFLEAGSFPVTLTVFGEGGCESSLSKDVINISPSAIAAFTSSPVVEQVMYVPSAEVQFINESENGSRYLWDFGDGNYSELENPVHNFTDPGLYDVTLTVFDEKNCVSTVVVGSYDVRVEGLFIPNILTPNNDGVNDFFQIRYEGSGDIQFEIFDRWGRRYFVGDSPTDVWRGTTLNGELAAEGVYFYVITIDGKAYSGTVTLLR